MLWGMVAKNALCPAATMAFARNQPPGAGNVHKCGHKKPKKGRGVSEVGEGNLFIARGDGGQQRTVPRPLTTVRQTLCHSSRAGAGNVHMVWV